MPPKWLTDCKLTYQSWAIKRFKSDNMMDASTPLSFVASSATWQRYFTMWNTCHKPGWPNDGTTVSCDINWQHKQNQIIRTITLITSITLKYIQKLSRYHLSLSLAPLSLWRLWVAGGIVFSSPSWSICHGFLEHETRTLKPTCKTASSSWVWHVMNMGVI